MSMPGQTIGVSVFTEPLMNSLSIGRDDLSLAYMLGTIGSSFLLPWAGRKYDQFGVRPVVVSASIGLGGILLVLSKIDVILLKTLAIDNNLLIVCIMIVVFLLLRFFGQGVLTMASRNMTVKWFDQKRGLATGFSNVFVSLGFSYSPVVLYDLIQNYEWNGAWMVLSVVAICIFPVLVILFFRDNPEECELEPDGFKNADSKSKKNTFKVIKNFNLKEARRHYTFWICALMLAMQGLYITAFTFHVVSIFEFAGLPEREAIRIFQPSAVIAVLVTLVASYISDRISVKPLFILKGISACVAILGVVLLGSTGWARILIIAGNGVMGGLFAVLMSVTWPRYFGRLHLGAISGQVISLIVFGSALGPIIFSQSLTHFNSYQNGAFVCFFIYLLLTIGVLWTSNPQKSLLEV